MAVLFLGWEVMPDVKLGSLMFQKVKLLNTDPICLEMVSSRWFES
jgi:hypothetical protein